MAGIAAGFGAVFGTPIAGAVFALEVLTIGRMQYEALIRASLLRSRPTGRAMPGASSISSTTSAISPARRPARSISMRRCSSRSGLPASSSAWSHVASARYRMLRRRRSNSSAPMRRCSRSSPARSDRPRLPARHPAISRAWCLVAQPKRCDDPRLLRSGPRRLLELVLESTFHDRDTQLRFPRAAK